jgi:xanthine/uracil/vitamin C permease (AzgA family)
MVVMTFTENAGIGLSAGVLVYPVFMAAAGKRNEIHRHSGGWLPAPLFSSPIFPY